MNERERMLAEGPRVAPEPPSATPSTVADTAAKPDAPPRTRAARRPIARLIPLAIFGVYLLANRYGAGSYAFWVFPAFVACAIAVRAIRKRGG
jgi:hypothetical protein